MPAAVSFDALPEAQIAVHVEALAADAARRAELVHLLREDHDIYNQRGAAAITRIRGWVLITLARVGVTDASLIFVLEELDASLDAYLVAAAARALRSYPSPSAAFAPFVMRAMTNMEGRDEPVSFKRYGEYVTSSTGTSPIRELLATLAWLGPAAQEVRPELEALRGRKGALPRELVRATDRTIAALRADDRAGAPVCCELPAGVRGIVSWARDSASSGAVGTTVFEDHQGQRLTFDDFFKGHSSIVVFFYTRCDNPLKCSLTVTKLARVQRLLEARGLEARIQTAAITYDPGFDRPVRLRSYGERRGVHLDASHRMLRAIDGLGPLRRHFKLGVNFIESLVNRHRIEAYVLDAEGRVAFSFERLRWDEQEVVERAIEALTMPTARPTRSKSASVIVNAVSSFGLAFLPKCPVCWSAYLSALGIAGLERVPYSPWLQPLLVVVLLINLASMWLRWGTTGRLAGPCLATAGALAIILSQLGWPNVAGPGVGLTIAGSLLTTFGAEDRRRNYGRARSTPCGLPG